MKRNILFAIALLVTMNVAAQTTKEVYVGYSRVMNEYEFSIFGQKKTGTGYGNGVEAGINYIRPISEPFAVTYGIQALYGWSEGIGEFTNVWETDQFIKFHVPVSVLIEIRRSGKNFAIEPLAGLDCSFYAYGKNKRGGHTYDWFDGKDSMGVNRLQFGWHVGVNFVYKRYFLTMNYQRDFTNVDGVEGHVSFSSENYSNRWVNTEIRLGYRF